MYLIVNHNTNLLAQCFEELDRQEQIVAEVRQVFVEEVHPVLQRLTALPSWEHVSSIAASGGRAYPHLVLYLNPKHKDSPLCREIAREFHVLGEKEPSDSSLQVTYLLDAVSPEAAHFTLIVYGYLPASCHIEYVEEYIPAHVGKVPKVVCTGGENEPTA